MLEAPPEKPLELIPGWLNDDDRKVLLTGKAKSRKSWLAIELALSLASGRPFLDLYPLQKRYYSGAHLPNGSSIFEDRPDDYQGSFQQVLYIQAENSDYETYARTERIVRRDGFTEPSLAANNLEWSTHKYPGLGNLHYNIGPFVLSDDGVAELIETIRDEKYQTVVLDSLYNVWPPGVNDERSANELIAHLNRIIGETGCRLVVVHHASAKGEGGRYRNREAMGSTYFSSAWHERELSVDLASEQEHRLTVKVRGRSAESRTVHLQQIFSSDPEQLDWRETSDPASEKATQHAGTLSMFLETNSVEPDFSGKNIRLPDGWTQKGIAEALNWSQQEVSDALKGMRSAALLERL